LFVSRTAYRGYSGSLALLVSVLGGAVSTCSAHAITWTLNGTFADGGTVSGTFVYDPDLGSTQNINTFNIAVSGGNTGVFFPFDFTPANSAASVSVNGTQFFFGSLATYTGGEIYVVQFTTVSPLSDAGGVVNIDLASPDSANCFNCVPFRLFTSGTITVPVTLPSTPAPSTLILVLVGLGCAIPYAARHRRRQAIA
jgi:hypothetical protein